MTRRTNIVERRDRDDRIMLRFSQLKEGGEKYPYAVLEVEFPELGRTGIFRVVKRRQAEAQA